MLSQEYKHDLKVKAAYCYYKKNMKLWDIAKKLNISRVTLNKILKEAIDEGIVRINILDENNSIGLMALEEKVKKRFNLKSVRVVHSNTEDSLNISSEIALETSRLIKRHIVSGMKISISWGRTLELMVNYLPGDTSIKDIVVYTLQGSQGIEDMAMQPNMIAYNLLRKYQGTGKVMNAPFLCESAETAKAIMNDGSFTAILEGAKKSHVTLVGIGSDPKDLYSSHNHRYSKSIIDELKKHNVCGDICSNFYDIYGNICAAPVCERFIKVGLDEIKSHNYVVGLAGGRSKITSILGALNGGYLDALVTDRSTITEVLDLADKL